MRTPPGNLPIVRAIATAHGAIMATEAPPTGGLIITLTFPSTGSTKGGA